MDVHPPHEPIHSIRDFLLHLFTITVGLLIALSLEALVEHVHNRHKVHEAESALAREIEENRQEIEKTLPFYGHEQQQIRILLGVLSGPDQKKTFTADVDFQAAGLNQDSYNTAQLGGALALMDYAETKHYADVYAVQSEFMGAQRSTFQNHASALIGSFFADPAHPAIETDAERAILRDRLRVYSGDLFLLKALANELDREYKKGS